MAIQRVRRPPHAVVTLQDRALTLYEVKLSKASSRAWRALLLRPSPKLLTLKFTPELGRLELHGSSITFRTVPSRLHAWLRRIDLWLPPIDEADDDVIDITPIKTGQSDLPQNGAGH
jgi:hypothetical protein